MDRAKHNPLTKNQISACLKVLLLDLRSWGLYPDRIIYMRQGRYFATNLGNIPDQAVLSATEGDCQPLDNWLIWFTLDLRKN